MTNFETKTILRIDRLRSSVNGNPAYDFSFTDGDRARSTSDAGWCYAVGNPGMRKGSTVSVSYTRAGRISIMRGEGER